MKFWLAVGGLTLALCGSAQAQTVISPYSETSRPYQRWVDEARAPTPDVTLTVVEQRCPFRDVKACTAPWDNTIWVGLSLPVFDRFAFLHELGHDWFYFTGGDWQSETLAESYAYCAFGMARARSVGLRALRPTGSRQVCYRLRHQIPFG